MKARITIIVKNNSPARALGENPEEKIRKAYDLLFALMAIPSENGDEGKVEKVEILEEE